jgi:hypothetical protein
VFKIKQALRHECVLNTVKYICTIQFKDEGFQETVVATPEKIRDLGKAGWMKFGEIEFNGTLMLFYRKPTNGV